MFYNQTSCFHFFESRGAMAAPRVSLSFEWVSA